MSEWDTPSSNYISHSSFAPVDTAKAPAESAACVSEGVSIRPPAMRGVFSFDIRLVMTFVTMPGIISIISGFDAATALRVVSTK